MNDYDPADHHHSPGLIFDFINGFHDACKFHCHSGVHQGVDPAQAVLWAAMFNLWPFSF